MVSEEFGRSFGLGRVHACISESPAATFGLFELSALLVYQSPYKSHSFTFLGNWCSSKATSTLLLLLTKRVE